MTAPVIVTRVGKGSALTYDEVDANFVNLRDGVEACYFDNIGGDITVSPSGTAAISSGVIVNADINAAAAIAITKLESVAAGSVIMGDAVNTPTATAITGDISINATGVAAISGGVIVNADINAAAAISDTKLDSISTANKVALSALDIDGSADIGAALADGDLFIVDDGASGTNRKAASTRISEYVFSKVTGDVTIGSSGTATIGAGVIVNNDINASAAIAGTKISPSFGNQTVSTTAWFAGYSGDSETAPSFTWSGRETTGLFTTGTASVGIASGGFEVCRVDTNGETGSTRRIEFASAAQISTTSGALYLRPAANTFMMSLVGDTTASSANVVVSSSTGRVQRSTSAQKYKTDIESVELSYSENLIYGSRPIWYRSLCEADPDSYSYWGFLAEEVAEIDRRMVHWGGEDGLEPEGVQYERYVVHLVKIAQQQKALIDDLLQRVSELEAR